MSANLLFIINSILLGVGLAMDAFSVSIADALNEPGMRKRKMIAIAGVFAGFQFLMPMTGWICVHTIVEMFTAFQKYIPWISLTLLSWIGIGMVKDGMQNHTEEAVNHKRLTIHGLLIQAVATSIDALSVGFTIAEYDIYHALLSSFVIGFVTMGICSGGLLIGKKAGGRLTNRASILGGLILIGIGLEIFISSFFE